MAKIDPASLFTELSGNVGGVIFGRSASGHYARRLKRPKLWTSEDQLLLTQWMHEIAFWWNFYKAAIRNHPIHGDITVKEWWDYFAADPAQARTDIFGGTYNPSGYNLFLAYNIFGKLDGTGFMELPPEDPIPAPWDGFSFMFRYSYIPEVSYFKAPTTTADEDARVWIYARLDRRYRGKHPSTPPYRFIKSFNYTVADSEYNLNDDLNAAFGISQPLSSLFVQVLFRHTNGYFSQPIRFQAQPNIAYTYTA